MVKKGGEKKCRKRTVPNAIDGGIRENSLLVEVGPVTRLLNHRGWEAMSIGLVVGQLIVHEIVDLQIVFLVGPQLYGAAR